MNSFRFMHAADLHLDSPFRGLTDLPQSVRKRVQESTFQALDNLVETALQAQVDFVVIAGDIYDAEDRSVRAQLRFHRAMERLTDAGIAVYIAHGNHDPLDGRRMQLEIPEGIHIFGGKRVETFVFANDAGHALAHLHGISFPTAAVTDCLAEQFRVHDPTLYNIAVLHTNVDASSEHDNYAPASREQLIRSGMDYWALGHIHARRILHEYPFIVYPGNTQGRSVKETGAKGCYVVDVGADKATTLSFRALHDVRWLTSRIEIAHCRTEWELKKTIEDTLQHISVQSASGPCMIRLTLHGRSELYRLLSSSSLLEELSLEWNREQTLRVEDDGKYPFCWLESCTLDIASVIDRQTLMTQDNFIGEMLRIAEEWKHSPEMLNTALEEAASVWMQARMSKYLRTRKAGGTPVHWLDESERLELLAQAEALLLDMLVDGETGR